MVLLLALVSLAHAQSTTLTVSAVALTSDPIKVGGHAIAETIEIPLTFSKAATVVGMPTITSGTTGTERTGEQSGAGRAPDELQFSHTVATGDQDTDGIAVATNSLVLNGGTIRASAASGALSHGAVQAGDHNMDRAAPTLAPNDVTPVTVQFSQNVYLVAETDDPSRWTRRQALACSACRTNPATRGDAPRLFCARSCPGPAPPPAAIVQPCWPGLP